MEFDQFGFDFQLKSIKMKFVLTQCFLVVLAVKLTTAHNNITYPQARRDESIVDDLHGYKVADPYRWLENSNSEETKQFVGDENKLSQLFLENDNTWQKINKKLTSMWDYPKYTTPQRYGKYYYSFRNTGLQNQAVIYRQSSMTDEPTVFLDPNALSSDGTASLDRMAFSEDGSLLAYGLSESGSDWIKIKFRDVETGKDYPDLLQQVKLTSLTWTHDNKGLLYCRFDQGGNGSETDSSKNQKLYYHLVGEPQENDVLVAEFPENPLWLISAQITYCGKYLIVTASFSSNQYLYFADLEKNDPVTGKIQLTQFIFKPDVEFYYVANIGSKAVFRTNENATNYRLVVIDFENFAQEHWTTLVEEDQNDMLRWAQVVNKDKIVVSYIHDVKSVLRVYSLQSGALIRTLPLEIGQVVGFTGHYKYSEIFYKMISFLTPGTVYRYDFAKPNAEPEYLYEDKLNLEGFDKKNFKIEQKFYPSHDGTIIPMYIIQKKLNLLNSSRPTVLFGYGGLNFPLMPSFRIHFLFFMNEFDGIVAIANIRGGSEYGKKWHDGGRLLNKQNVFDDFQAAAMYLVEHKYTVHEKIAIKGASNGGLLVGACITQRPELFGAAVAQVGVLDMLRYHKFTIGHAWISDFGNPDEKIHFENLYKYSPLHNVRSPNSTANQFPSTLIQTGDHDNRVSPLHSLKFTAELQYKVKNNQFQKNPILLRVYNKAGHGEGKPTSKEIDEETDVYTFLYKTLNIKTEL